LREPSYFILAALLDGPLHGYAVIKRVEELSAGRVRLAAGTLYTALDRLAAEGLLQVVTEEVVNGRARRYYGLTENGDLVVHAEAERMASAAALVTKYPRRTPLTPKARPA
jgi:DNA-binding PadR family transcriptional regulator